MLSAGTTLGGRYRLDDRIAGGGMGDVWRGTDEVLGRTVAIKVLLPALLEEPGFAERFRGEARTMATINHPGVVDIYDYGSENGTAFLIMEYVEGDALSRTLSRVSRLTPSRAMALIAQAADALHAAHQKGIVRRDVKPGNLLVRPNGTLVLTDFGIARSAAVAQLTAAGSVLGTASYISPEQASGSQATPLSDVYALGVVAYQCLSGQRPFEGDNPLEIAMRHVRDMPPPLPADIPPLVAQLVERAMAKDPAARWPSAAALAQAARRAVQGGATGTGPAVPARNPVSGPPVSGSPVSGSPVSPSYGPPVSGSPMSGMPMSGPPTNVPGGGGTRIMPGGALPPLAGASAAGMPGHQARGAAGVPPPPPSGDTATFIGATGGYPGGPGGYQPPPPGPRTSGSGNRNNLVMVGIGAIVLLVLLGIGGIYLATRGDDKPSDTGNSNPSVTVTTEAAKPTQSATGKPVAVSCNPRQLRQAVESDLTRKGMKVTVVEDPNAKGIPGAVTKVEPCGNIAAGTAITLTVVPPFGGPRNNTSSVPEPSQPGADNGGSPSAGAPNANPSCAPPKILINGVCV